MSYTEFEFVRVYSATRICIVYIRISHRLYPRLVHQPEPGRLPRRHARFGRAVDHTARVHQGGTLIHVRSQQVSWQRAMRLQRGAGDHLPMQRGLLRLVETRQCTCSASVHLQRISALAAHRCTCSASVHLQRISALATPSLMIFLLTAQ